MRINKKSDLPSFFDLRKYTDFNNLSDEDILSLLVYRADLYNCSIEKSDAECLLSNPLIGYSPEEIKTMTLQIGNDNNDSVKLSETSCIHPTSLFDLEFDYEYLGEELRKKYDINNSRESLLRFLKHVNISLSAIEKIKKIDDAEIINIKVDLSYSDDFILNDIKKLIPIWRDELNICTKNKQIVPSWEITRKKLIEYSVFPLIDLKLWARANNCTITNKVLAVTLFPLGEYGEMNLIQTIIPFVDKILDVFSIEKFIREVYLK
ncbi:MULTISPECIES: DUF6387 family protein [Proteus]|uniref:DUF6387 family protein n=1 Tax=Proteus TaxID=583 RepID=UPI00019CFF54|nr:MULTISPECIES: DUF6387 family protein [Proteus]EEI46704.1 hypothetical protein HMPREF0693_3563 [Proteus mirabilis ATCC 29906]MDC5889998.1 DUF6387 family protein [Proteus mirabilis]MDC5911133.1 DUF6387 family protein [Proteus mirabilis]MDC6003079.1 DUF6387 family protein [Proteus mirabilis]NBN05135.1 hypothetical protein [Proteus sp. G2665]